MFSPCWQTMSKCSFSEALECRYGEDLEEESSPEIFLVGSFPGRSSPTSGRLVLPRTLTLNRCGIDCAGSHRKIEELCGKVEELDLAQNYLSDLSEIDVLLQHMPNLSFLNLSHNDLSEAMLKPLTHIESMKSLVLNCTHVPWDIVCGFLEAMPNLQELHLSLNDYTSVGLPPECHYPNLRQLYLCGSRLSSWEDVMRLGEAFPHMECLVAADTPLSRIPEPRGWEDRFPHLQTLNLNNAPLAEWTDVDRLNAFRKLEDVRLQNMPVLEDLNEPERRQHLIAYLPSVERLNGSAITPKEREDAERAFIRHFLHHDPQDRPRRVSELEAVHGKLAPLVDVDLSPKKTAQVFVNFCEEQSVVTVNLQQSVQELKHSLSERFGLRPARMRLFYLDQDLKDAHGPDELRYNGRKLYSYQIRDGDELLIVCKV
ncbi:tubulin-specific chaperone cofactor E-like protein [Uloborus diversus]|uniref:tubulin-specific chaperone cofactor E-like protein n=1 Tax=Uloborus diversus TaxID=327109 RepID=UPI002409CAB4|nr:tubulin-specific chaperone cofactor E-like protein [Uloborus diversus]